MVQMQTGRLRGKVLGWGGFPGPFYPGVGPSVGYRGVSLRAPWYGVSPVYPPVAPTIPLPLAYRRTGWYC